MTQQVEARLVNEYLRETWPDALQWKRVRLGPARDKKEAQMYKVLMRWADAVVYDGINVYIIEAKMRANAGAIGQLEHYAELFPMTHEFKLYKCKPVKLILLSAILDVDITAQAQAHGIDPVLFSPDWAKEYFIK